MEEAIKALQAFYVVHGKIIQTDACWHSGDYPVFTKAIWEEYTKAMDSCYFLLHKYDKLSEA